LNLKYKLRSELLREKQAISAPQKNTITINKQDITDIHLNIKFTSISIYYSTSIFPIGYHSSRVRPAMASFTSVSPVLRSMTAISRGGGR